jgi:hypothetical protein
MKPTMAGLLLGALLHAAPAAFAATTIDTAGFSLSYLNGYGTAPVQMNLLSNEAGTVRLGIDIAPLDSYAESNFSAIVHEGYRITSITWSATLTGELRPGQLDVCPSSYGCDVDLGTATNRGEFWAPITQNGTWVDVINGGVLNVDGTAALSATSTQPLQGAFSMLVAADAYAYATPTQVVAYYPDYETYHSVDSYAALSMRDVVLTIQVAAVPEPGTYAMLLAGMGVLGVAARRRMR